MSFRSGLKSLKLNKLQKLHTQLSACMYERWKKRFKWFTTSWYAHNSSAKKKSKKLNSNAFTYEIIHTHTHKSTYTYCCLQILCSHANFCLCKTFIYHLGCGRCVLGWSCCWQFRARNMQTELCSFLFFVLF